MIWKKFNSTTKLKKNCTYLFTYLDKLGKRFYDIVKTDSVFSQLIFPDEHKYTRWVLEIEDETEIKMSLTITILEYIFGEGFLWRSKGHEICGFNPETLTGISIDDGLCYSSGIDKKNRAGCIMNIK